MWFWPVCIILVLALSYLSSLRGDFVLDDWALIVDRANVHSLSHIPWAFQTRFLPNSFGPNLFYYRPFTIISYQLNYALAGSHPFQFRLTNLLLQIVVALLVFLIARKLINNTTAAGLAGIAFAALPCHVEAVGWVSGRTDVLAAVFMLGSMLVFMISFNRSKEFSWPLALLSSVLFLFAMLSKEQAMILPALLIGYVWVYGGMQRRDIIRWVIALLPPILIIFVLRKLVVGSDMNMILWVMLAQRVLCIGLAYASYLRMMFLPTEPHVVYDVFPIGMRYPAVALAAWLLPAGLVVLTWWARKKAPMVALGAWWIFIAVLPVSNLLPSLSALPAERFAYCASIGAAFILGWAAWKMLQWRPKALATWPIISVVLVLGYVAYCGALTISGCRYYSSSLEWAKAIQASDTRFVPFRAAAASYFADAGYIAGRSGDTKAAIEYYSESVRGYEAALKGDPDDTRVITRIAGAKRNLNILRKQEKSTFPGVKR